MCQYKIAELQGTRELRYWRREISNGKNKIRKIIDVENKEIAERQERNNKNYRKLLPNPV